MHKRRKEGGFTLIELMIVIAVIGILAVVLIPKVGTIKTQAKLSGIDTNIRAVEAYVQSRISSWNAASTGALDIVTDITGAFSGTSALENPLDDGTTAISVHTTAVPAPSTGVAGSIYVTIADDGDPIKIDAYDSAGKLMVDKQVTLEP